MNQRANRGPAAAHATSVGSESTASYRMCIRCVMDTSDPEIVFDEHGVCNHCARAALLLKTSLPEYKSGEYRLDRLVRRNRAEGQGKPHHCIVGVSGGADSTYAAYAPKKGGRRPPAGPLPNRREAPASP